MYEITILEHWNHDWAYPVYLIQQDGQTVDIWNTSREAKADKERREYIRDYG